MTLIQSISGIRGTHGGRPGEGLSPVDVMKFAGAYGMWVKSRFPGEKCCVVIGRDARISGPMVNKIVTATLQAMGIDIIDAGVTTTPTTAIGVSHFKAQGGIIITASHNPRNWNALKLLNHQGMFLTAEQGCEMEAYMDVNAFEFVPVDKFGQYRREECLVEVHIEKILSLPLVDVEAIRAAGCTVAIDGVNSSGGIAVPMLLDALGVSRVVEVYCEPNGQFPHNPEPLPENLGELSSVVVSKNAHVGFAVDPDVDRLAIVCEDGEMFGEEYTLVAVADYVLSNTPGNTVSNLSSTQALKEITEKHGQQHFSSAVGEVNVVEMMKKRKAVIGGEGNGGVIYPELHFGRDALTGIALFLTHLAKFGKPCSLLKKKYPEYHISKNKIELPEDLNMDKVFEFINQKYQRQPIDNTDGTKIIFEKEWVHLRKSNTEPIIRIYAESDSMIMADNLANKIISDIREFIKGEEED
jgi:phosphomannomutase